jgi:hypothetical protein
MFDWWPRVDLNTLKEDLSRHRPGYSFLQEPANQLQTSFKDLLEDPAAIHARMSNLASFSNVSPICSSHQQETSPRHCPAFQF